MIEVKTSELVGPALDWAVAKAEGFETQLDMDGYYDTRLGREVTTALYLGSANVWEPSANWSQGGPLIEREGLDLRKRVTDVTRPNPRLAWKAEYVATNPYRCAEGPTPLIAAMRCLVEAKLGDTAQVPAELLTQNP